MKVVFTLQNCPANPKQDLVNKAGRVGKLSERVGAQRWPGIHGLVRIIGAGALALGLAGPTLAQDATPKPGGVAVFALETDPTYLARNLGTASETGTVACILYQGLMGIDAEGVPYPLLAKSVEISDDNLTYSFVLNDVQWQDGEQLTADDVKYTFEEISGKHSPTFMRTMTTIDKIEVVSDTELTITLKAPYAPILLALGVQSRHLVDRVQDESVRL